MVIGFLFFYRGKVGEEEQDKHARKEEGARIGIQGQDKIVRSLGGLGGRGVQFNSLYFIFRGRDGTTEA